MKVQRKKERKVRHLRGHLLPNCICDVFEFQFVIKIHKKAVEGSFQSFVNNLNSLKGRYCEIIAIFVTKRVKLT